MHSEEGERVVSLALSTRHIGERCVLTLVGALQLDIFLTNILSTNRVLLKGWPIL